MIKDKINSIFNSRIFRLIFSFLVAIALWVYVEYVINEDIESGPIRVNIEFLNPELVTDQGLVITEYSTQSITYRFSGKRSNINKLEAEGAIRVTVNLAEITAPGQHTLQPVIVYGDGINRNDLSIKDRTYYYIHVNVEKLYSDQVQVIAKVDGQLAADGYLAEAPAFSPETITISGPQSELERVDKARVNIQRQNLTKTTVITDMEFVLIDADGEIVESNLITTDRSTVNVTIPIYMIKEIPLAVTLIPGAGAVDGENISWKVYPETITLSGDPEELSGMNSLSVATIDLTSFESFYSGKHQIILPNEVTNVTGVSEAEVTISIKGLATRTLSVPLQNNVQFMNETPGYSVSLITSVLEVVIRGPAEELDTITEENIRLVIDMKEFGETTSAFTVSATIRIDGDTATNCGAIGEYTVRVQGAKDDT